MKKSFGVGALLGGLAVAGAARAEPVRIVVAAGHRYGAAEERPLQYARDDAARVADIFRQIGGARPEHTILLDEPAATDLATALERARAIAATHRPEEVSLIFYFSGHGDRDRLHLAGELVPIADLAARVARIPAALRVVVLDACRTDDVRQKGMAQDNAFAVSLDSGGSGSAAGTVWIHASAEGDPAQESRDLAGGVFTHYWLSGLRGAADADGDRRVTLAEAYEFAYHQTLFRSARASGVLQRPTAQFDLREMGPIVLTTPTPTTARLLLPQVADTHFLVYEPRSRHVLSEAWSAPERRIALALAPGSYLVQRRAAGRGGAAEVSLARGEEHSLSPSDFHDVSLETLARKGGSIVLHPNEVELAYLPAAQNDFGVVQRAGVRYQRRFDGFAFGIGAYGAIGNTTTEARRIDETTVGGSLLAEWRPEVGPVTLRFGGGPVVEWIAQKLDRLDAARAQAAAFTTEEKKHAVGAGLSGSIRASWPFAKPVFATAGGQASGVAVPTTTGNDFRWTAGGDFGMGVEF